MKKLWAGLFRTEGNRHIWYKNQDGAPWRVPIGVREMQQYVFASPVASRLGLRLCVELGERGTLEVPTNRWDDFRRELETLAKHTHQLSTGSTYRDEFGRTLEENLAFDHVIARLIEALDQAEQFRGEGAVLSIASV